MGRLWAVVATVAKYSEWALLGLLSVLAAARYADLTQYSEPWRGILNRVQESNFILVLAIAGGVLALKIVNDSLEASEGNLRAVKGVLDTLHRHCFRKIPEGQLFEHRVTLFRAKKRFGVGRPRYLKIYARSGTQYQKSRTSFLIDDEDEAKNEGMAGQAWFKNAFMDVVDLPSWPLGSNPDPEQDPVCCEYAEKGKLTVKKASSLKVKSRSVIATVVRASRGKKWGVLVVDSRHPRGVTRGKRVLLDITAEELTHMVLSRP